MYIQEICESDCVNVRPSNLQHNVSLCLCLERGPIANGDVELLLQLLQGDKIGEVPCDVPTGSKVQALCLISA